MEKTPLLKKKKKKKKKTDGKKNARHHADEKESHDRRFPKPADSRTRVSRFSVSAFHARFDADRRRARQSKPTGTGFRVRFEPSLAQAEEEGSFFFQAVLVRAR